MTDNAKKGLLGVSLVGACVTVIAAASYMLTDNLINMAIDRNYKDKKVSPKTSGKKKKRSVRGYEPDPFIVAESKLARENLEQTPMEDVEITSYDGTNLVGHWYAAPNPKRIILAMHGWKSSWSNDFSMITDFWHKNDCSILYVEQRGQGNSGGEYMGFGLMERFDCLEWARFINENYSSTLPIYLTGISMGASTVLMSANLEMPENVKGIIADCGFTSPHAIWKHVAVNNLKIPYGVVGVFADNICKKKIMISSKDYSTVMALRESKVPVALIHGTDDHFVPVTMTFDNYKACTSKKSLFVVPGANHGLSYRIDKAGYEKFILDFWSDCEA